MYLQLILYTTDHLNYNSAAAWKAQVQQLVVLKMQKSTWKWDLPKLTNNTKIKYFLYSSKYISKISWWLISQNVSNLLISMVASSVWCIAYKACYRFPVTIDTEILHFYLQLHTMRWPDLTSGPIRVQYLVMWQSYHQSEERSNVRSPGISHLTAQVNEKLHRSVMIVELCNCSNKDVIKL